MKKTLLLVSASMFCLVYSVRAQAPLWEQTNGPSGRWITAINFDSSGNVYVIATNGYGIASDHLYRSGDDGATWEVMLQAPLALSTLSNGDLLASFDSSIRISKDHGASWISILPNMDSRFSHVTTGTTAGDIFVSTNLLLRSSDEGGHWDTLPQAPDIGEFGSYYTTTLFSSGGDGNQYRSTDRGESWTKIVNGVVNGIGPIAGGINGKMWAEIGEDAAWSTDDGRTWSKSTPTAHNEQCVTFCKNGFAVAPYEFQYIEFYDQNGKLTKSISSGLFTLISNHVGPSAIGASPNGEVWLAEGPTLFKINPNSDDSFTNVSLPTGGVKFIVATTSGSIIASSGILPGLRVSFGYSNPTDLLLYSSVDGGKTWSAILGSDYLSPLAMDSDKGLLAGMPTASPYPNGVMLSTNAGFAWTPLGSPLTTTTITSIVVDPSGNIYTGCGEGVFRSTDKGTTWDQLNSGITDFNIQSLAVSKTGEIFAGTPTAIFHSTDLGLNWQALPFTPPDTSGIISLTINTAGDLLAAMPNAGIFWSHDDGNSWSSIGTGLNGKVNAIFSTPSGHVFAGTTTGVFYLPMGGGTWVDATAGLGNVSVLSITRDPSGTVYLGTDGEGVFRSTQTYNSIERDGVNNATASITNLSLGQVYPNPMQNYGAVTIGIPAASPVRVELLNALGERVKLVADRPFDAGSYSLGLDTHGLPNGVYYLMLTATDAVKAEKVTIAR